MSESIQFGDLKISFDDNVLRPREWTTAQSSWAASLLHDSAPDGPVLELCSGAGHIGMLAVAGSGRRLVCVDANPVASDYARRNADAAGLAGQTEVRTGLIDSSLDDDELFAVIIADPPWVPDAETGRFPEDPLLAIDGGEDGLDVARTCLGVIDRHLMPGGAAVLQLGSEAQVEVLRAEAQGGPHALTLSDVQVHERGVLVLVRRTTDVTG